jgi:hypothetical protein
MGTNAVRAQPPKAHSLGRKEETNRHREGSAEKNNLGDSIAGRQKLDDGVMNHPNKIGRENEQGSHDGCMDLSARQSWRRIGFRHLRSHSNADSDIGPRKLDGHQDDDPAYAFSACLVNGDGRCSSKSALS